MKKIVLLGIVFLTMISLFGCKTQGKTSGGTLSEIEEAEVEKDSNKEVKDTPKEVVATVEPGEKVQVNETIKNKILSIAPALTEYEVGKTISDQMKFRFVYYGYINSDLSRYTKKEIDVEGVKNTWALVPKQEVDNNFKEVFGIDLGEYKPTLNEDDPTVYYANNYYYICTTSEPDKVNYSLLNEGDSVVKLKESYEGDDRYNEINVTLQTANNSNGFVITKVISIPK